MDTSIKCPLCDAAIEIPEGTPEYFIKVCYNCHALLRWRNNRLCEEESRCSVCKLIDKHSKWCSAGY